jgi:hypothetical protein
MPFLLYFTLPYLLANLGKAKAPGSPQSFRGMKFGAPNSSGGTPSTHLFTLRRGTAQLFFQFLCCPGTGSRRFPGAAARGGGRDSPSYSTLQTRLSTLLRYPTYLHIHFLCVLFISLFCLRFGVNKLCPSEPTDILAT